MPRYVVHIGPPKAGSKYLQTSLSGLHKVLAEVGILYPTTLLSEEPRISHAVLNNALRAGPSAALDHAFAELNDTGHDVVVLSWEGAFSLPDEALAYFRRLIGPRNDVALVYYCRRFAERIPSLWKQEVKKGRATTLPEVVAREMRSPLRTQDHNASLVWARWAGVFGRDSLNLVSFNNLRDANVDLFTHFATHFLHWYGTERAKRVVVHASPNAADTEMLRALNAIHLAETGTEGGMANARYPGLKATIDHGPIPEAMAAATASLMLDDRAEPFLPVYDAMLAFRDRLVSPDIGAELFNRAVSEVRYVRPDYLLRPGVAEALHAVYRALSAGDAAPADERDGG
jgi:hypothetical protein